MASCKGTIDWQTGVDGGKYGPMGEDLFAQACLDANGVSRGEALGTKLDGTCEADRPAEEKKKQKVEAHVRRRELPGVPPADEARGLLGVLGGHHQGVRLLKRREEPLKPRCARRSAPASCASTPSALPDCAPGTLGEVLVQRRERGLQVFFAPPCPDFPFPHTKLVVSQI